MGMAIVGLTRTMIDRRSFLAGMAIGVLPGCVEPAPRLVIKDAYSIWYNRPSAIALGRGSYLISSISSRGEARLSRLQGDTADTMTLTRFDGISDHGTPAIVRYGDKIVFALANHSSPVFVGSVRLEDWTAPTGQGLSSIDDGHCTYPSFLRHGGDLLLFYTKLHRDDRGLAHRSYVVRRSSDAGESWSEPTTCIPAVPGIFPYPVPPFETSDGRVWIVFSKLLITGAREMPTQHLYLLHSNDGGRSWVDDRGGAPAWVGPENVMFQVYDACSYGHGIRTVSLCADGRWGDSWTSVGAFVVDFDRAGSGTQAAYLESVSWQQYPNGAIIRRDRPDRLLVAQIDGGGEEIGEWRVAAGVTSKVRSLQAPGGLVFPFQADDGAIFAHTNYRGTATNDFYSDIVLIGG